MPHTLVRIENLIEFYYILVFDCLCEIYTLVIMKSFFPLALLVILCLPTSVLLAQNYCGFDQFMQHHHADDAS